MDLDSWRKDHPKVDNVVAAVCDLNGTLRGKRIPVDQLQKVLDGGMRMPLSASGVDIWGEDIESSELVFETGDADGICEGTGRGVLPISWTPTPSALVPLWLTEESGAPFMGDPRRALADVVRRFADKGLTPVVATELEFYLVDPSGEKPPASVFSGDWQAPGVGRGSVFGRIGALRGVSQRGLHDLPTAGRARGFSHL